jgi:hypothetical protein
LAVRKIVESEAPFDADAGRPKDNVLVHVFLGNDKQGMALLIEAKEGVYPRDARRLLERFTSHAHCSRVSGEVPLPTAGASIPLMA